MNLSSARLTTPKMMHGEMLRQKLIDRIVNDHRNIIYVQAGAGYGKTTLLAQMAREAEYVAWLSLAGETDTLTFAESLCEAVRRAFPQYSFQPSECFPFLEKENFTAILANALIGSIEHLSKEVLFILDDLHTIQDSGIKELISCVLRFLPENMRLCFGSREAPWTEFSPLRVRGHILELNQGNLAFTEAEAAQIMSFNDEEIYHMTEGWPLAVGSFRVLLENGVSPTDIPSQGADVLSSYLFYECISRLPAEMVEFLKGSAYFDDLDAAMLDSVMDRKNSKLILESLTARNLFTSKTDDGHYRYHALFKKCLLESVELSQESELWRKAAQYYWETQDFLMSAKYAIALNDRELLEKIILKSYRKLIQSGCFSELRQWFQVLGEDYSGFSSEILVAKGAYLSCIGNFTSAQKALDCAIPRLDEENHTLYMEAMLHKARVLRNFVSFDASNALLDRLMLELEQCKPETVYLIVAEKLYNLCWNSQIRDAYILVQNSIEWCARAGKIKIKAWFERYLTAVHFFAGRMKEAVNCYEKSLSLPEEDREYLDMHGVGIYAAKAYQMLGNRESSLSVLADALGQMKRKGKYEEMWSGYLFAAEIYFQNATLDRSNGKEVSYETTKKYFALADEYAPLYRKTEYQQQWANMQRLTYSVMFESGEKEPTIRKIFEHLNECSDYLKCIILARLMGYFAAIKDFSNASICAKQCVTVGETAGMLLHPVLAYGILARCCLAMEQWEDAKLYTGRCLRLCAENGIYEYFNALKDYGPVLQFASDNGIEPECAKQIMAFTGFSTKKAYIQTFGGFAIFHFNDRKNAIKMRTRKERELFAFLLDVGEQGATKEQIYAAIWSESESKNVKGLIGVNLTQIKKDLAVLGIENPILCNEKRYSACNKEIVCDFELFERATQNVGDSTGGEAESTLLSLYSGEYLSDFEAFWATSKRLKYQKTYDAALHTF